MLGQKHAMFEIFGFVFNIQTMVTTIIASILVMVFVLLGTRKMSSGVPKGMQNLLEWVIDFIQGFAEQFMGKKAGPQYVTLTVTLFLYILISNVMELVFIVEFKAGGGDYTWWKSPTAEPSVTFSLAFVVLLYAHILGLKRGGKHYIKRYTEPNPFIGPPLAIMEEFVIKPLTLPLRLFGNIFAGEVLILFLLGIVTPNIATWFAGGIPLVFWLGYSTFIAGIQAFIFTALTMVYISDFLTEEERET